MVTISLDEQGHFEEADKNPEELMFIAGAIYDDSNDENDADRERTRIKNYFQEICKSVGAAYPDDLHITNGNNTRVKIVKKEYGQSLGEFLTNGSRNGQPVLSDDAQPRSGKYYIYILVKSFKGKELLVKTPNDFINDNFASNLYLHMIEDTITRLLFANPLYPQGINQVRLDMPTRVFVAKDGDYSEHEQLGHSFPVNKARAYLTDGDIFRTTLDRELLVSEPLKDMDIALSAVPIKYKADAKEQEFLYLADAICSILGWNLDCQAGYLAELQERLEALCGKDNSLLYVYDRVDDAFFRAWKAVKQGNIYRALALYYQACQQQSEEVAFYKNRWGEILFNFLKQRVQSSPLCIDTAIRKLREDSRQDKIDTAKLNFIYEQLEKICEDKDVLSRIDKALLFDLYDTGIAAANHVGKKEKSDYCAGEAAKYEKYIGIERLIRNRHRRAVSLCDRLDFAAAEKLAEGSYDFYAKVVPLQKQLLNDTSCNSVEFAVACSQLGQIYAYRQDSRAEKMFLESLELYAPDTEDYFITLSYLLHYYLVAADKEGYEKYAPLYLGGQSDLINQLNFIIGKPQGIAPPYALYIFLKSLLVLYREKIPGNLAVKLISGNFYTMLLKINKGKQKGHPWEIILKYLALLAVLQRNRTAADFWRERLEELEGCNGIIGIIRQYGLIKIITAIDKKQKIDNQLKMLVKAIEEMNPSLKDKIRPELQAIEGLLTYTYN